MRQGVDTKPEREEKSPLASYFAVQENARSQAGGMSLADQLEAARLRLSGAPALLEWSSANPRHSEQVADVIRHTHVLREGLAAAVQAFCAARETDSESVALACFAALLSRYCAQKDLCLGHFSIPFAPNAAQILRISLDDSPHIVGLIQAIEQARQAAQSQADVSLAALLAALNLPAAQSHCSLVQVAFVSVGEMAARSAPTLHIAGLHARGCASKLDLGLSLDCNPSGWKIDIDYCPALFSASSVQRFAAHFEALLAGALAQPEQAMDRLEILSASERQQILIDWNRSSSPAPSQCVHRMFEAQVAKAPDAPAVVFGEQKLTYAELNARANQLAHYLRSQEVGQDVLVGVALERSVDMLVGMIAILKAGAAYVPLDPAYPADRLAYMIADAAPSLILSSQHLLERLPAHDCPVLCMDTECALWADCPQGNLAAGDQLSALAYVIYTSGSTGRPKGVLLEHAGLSNLCVAQAAAFEVDADSRVLQFASINFDASVSEAFVTLSQGACLYLLRPEALRSGLELVKVLEQCAISVVTLPPSLLAVLPQKELPTLSTLVLAGEAWAPELARRWAPGRRLLNAYGPTEGTVCATWAKVDADLSHYVPIGRALNNMQVYVLDEHMAPCPIGVAGEIYIGGIGVARAYLNQPGLTAERFVPNPFDAQPGARLYRSGDKARYLEDGQLVFLGRFDHQVKLRGYRIELGEVEAAVSSYANVVNAFVMVREDHPGERRLVAYVVPAPDFELEILKSQLKARLPDYMLPQHIICLAALPASPNGKVDRQALPSPAQARRSSPRSLSAA